jgi:hypothetical protein
MGKPITQAQKNEFRRFCRDLQQGEDNSGYFTIEDYEPFQADERRNGPLWEFHASNYNPSTSHDIFELFESVKDEFTIEQHQYDEFYAIPVKKRQHKAKPVR